MKGNNLSGPVILSLVIGLIVGFALGVLWQNSAQSDESVTETTQLGEVVLNDDEEVQSNEEESVFTTTISGSGSIEVDDQDYGDSVVVSKVVVDKGTWVGVREDVNGEFGNILGARLLEPGAHQNVEIPLLRGTVKGRTYHVVLFGDNGDRLFNHTVDSMLEMNGSTISDSMMTN